MVERLLTTRQAAQFLAVGPTSVKRWADDGRLPCVRTAGGHRRFEPEAVRAFSRSLEGSETEADAFIELLLEEAPAINIQIALLELRERRGGWTGAAAAVGEVLTRLGERWAENDLTVAQEHRATDRLHRAIAAVADQIAVAPSSPKLALMVAGDDQHALGLSLVELCAKSQGWSTQWLGVRTPIESVHEVLGSESVRLLAVSASSWSSDQLSLMRRADEFGKICAAHGVVLALGGTGAWPERPAFGHRLKTFEAFVDLLNDVYASGAPRGRAVSELSLLDGE